MLMRHQVNLDDVSRAILQETQPAKIKALRAQRVAVTAMLDEVQDELCLVQERFSPTSLEELGPKPSAAASSEPAVPPTKAPTVVPMFVLPAPPSAPPAIASAYSPTSEGDVVDSPVAMDVDDGAKGPGGKLNDPSDGFTSSAYVVAACSLATADAGLIIERCPNAAAAVRQDRGTTRGDPSEGGVCAPAPATSRWSRGVGKAVGRRVYCRREGCHPR